MILIMADKEREATKTEKLFNDQQIELSITHIVELINLD